MIKKLKKKSQMNTILMVILELVMIVTIGTAVVLYVNNVSKGEEFRINLITRDLALILSSQYASDDNILVNYTIKSDKDYTINIRKPIVNVSNNEYSKIFPFVSHKDTEIISQEIKTSLFQILKTNQNFTLIPDQN